MKKLRSLLKAAMSCDMNLFRINKKNESKMNKILFPIFLALFVMFGVGSYAYMFAKELAPMKLTYVVLTIFLMFTTLLTFVEGIYKSQGILFGAKDDDLLLSLPISKAHIFLVRILKLIVFQILYNSLFLLPAMVVYAVLEHPGVNFYFVSFAMLLLAPIIPTILGSIFGYLIQGLSSFFQAKKLVQVVFTSALLLLLFFASFRMQQMIASISEHASSIHEVITKLYYPAGLYIRLIQSFHWMDWFVLLVVSFVPALLFVYVGSIFYFSILSKMKGVGDRSKKTRQKGFDGKKYRLRSPFFALVFKEIKRFFSSPVFIINASFGMVLMIVVTFSLVTHFDGMAQSIIKSGMIGLSVATIKAMMPKIFYGLVVLMACMTSITSSMISLEGKSFLITKSLPIAPKKILFAKVIASNLLSIPILLVCDIVFFVSFSVALIDIVFILGASILVPTFTALFGLLMNLKYPKMDATSDTEVVKQSFSSMASVLVGFLTGILAIVVMILGIKINLNLVITLELLFFGIMVLGLAKRLATYGVCKWNELLA